ncbi:MAG: hypothetical protein H6Q17_2190 [Bacteroidetes bacterium]|nr:hypothetical protein [Bacteroidota bacterium]
MVTISFAFGFPKSAMYGMATRYATLIVRQQRLEHGDGDCLLAGFYSHTLRCTNCVVAGEPMR